MGLLPEQMYYETHVDRYIETLHDMVPTLHCTQFTSNTEKPCFGWIDFSRTIA